MKLNIDTIFCSPWDEENEMANVYFRDETQDYCFSLARVAESDVIEIMVSDQLVHDVESLPVMLTRDSLVAELDHEVALLLDGNTHYELFFSVDEKEFLRIYQSLQRIFEGKQGFSCAVEKEVLSE